MQITYHKYCIFKKVNNTYLGALSKIDKKKKLTYENLIIEIYIYIYVQYVYT